MKANDLNRYRMVLASQRYLDLHTAKWSSVPILTTFKNKLDTLIRKIKEKLKVMNESSIGLTLDKKQLKKVIGQKVAVLSGMLQAYAAENKSQALAKKTAFRMSDVYLTREIELVEILDTLVKEARDRLGALTEYGTSEAQLTDLETSIDDLREMIGKPRLIQSMVNVANAEATTLIDKSVKLLNEKIDKVLLQFKTTDPAFYNGYLRARVIVD